MAPTRPSQWGLLTLKRAVLGLFALQWAEVFPPILAATVHRFIP